jgi:dihydroorotate dehydrogenase (fumarate)
MTTLEVNMQNLKTTYLGLELDNPIIVGSCSLTKTTEGVCRAAEAGAGAVVLKSLFEEEVRLNYSSTTEAFVDYPHPEAAAYLQADLAAHYGADAYLDLVKESSRAVSIPVIASVNCVSSETWPTFARQLEASGAAAIELNIYIMPTVAGLGSEQVEEVYLKTAKAVAAEVKIPVAVKLVPYITNLTRLALQMQDVGASGLVLFNRFYHPDIDIETLSLSGGLSLSHPDEYRRTLRWMGLLYGRLTCDLCASTGVHDGATVIRQLLAGATAVQVTSAFYLHSLSLLQRMLLDLRTWMTLNSFDTIADFQGKVSRFHAENPDLFERAQYIKAFVGAE